MLPPSKENELLLVIIGSKPVSSASILVGVALPGIIDIAIVL